MMRDLAEAVLRSLEEWTEAAYGVALMWEPEEARHFIAKRATFDADRLTAATDKLRDLLIAAGAEMPDRLIPPLIDFKEEALLYARTGKGWPAGDYLRFRGRADASVSEARARCEKEIAPPEEARPADTPKKAGRPAPSKTALDEDARIAGDWRRAKEKGVAKKVFARDSGIRLIHLNRLLNRQAKREARQGKDKSS